MYLKSDIYTKNPKNMLILENTDSKTCNFGVYSKNMKIKTR